MSTDARVDDAIILKIAPALDAVLDFGGSNSSPPPSLGRKLSAEFCGVFLLMLVGCSMEVLIITSSLFKHHEFFMTGLLCIIWGAVFKLIILVFAPVSGAHFNPAVTLTFALYRRFPWKEVPLYVCAQIWASLSASSAVRIFFYFLGKDQFFGTIPADSDSDAFLMEFTASLTLMFVILDRANDYGLVGENDAYVVGFNFTIDTFLARPFSGGSFNLARTLGPAIVFGQYKGLWIYIFGPLCGCFSAAVVHYLKIKFTSFLNRMTSREDNDVVGKSDCSSLP